MTRGVAPECWPDDNCAGLQGDSVLKVAPLCPKCGRHMELLLPPDATGQRAYQRSYQCFDCDRVDPLKSDQVDRWIKSPLKPPE